MSSFLPEKNLYDSGFSNFIKLFSTSISYPLSLNGIEGIKRVSILEYFYVDELIEATIIEKNNEFIDDDIIKASIRKIKYELNKCTKSVPTISNSVIGMIDGINDLSDIIDIIVTYMPIDKKRLSEYANTLDSIKRCEMLLADIYKELDDGTGKCKYLSGNLCSIYDDRPLKCRIEDSYYAFFSDEMTKDEFYRQNYEMCKKLRNTNNNKKED